MPPVVALTLAALACYGTLAAIAILSLLGVTLAVSNAAVAGVVAFFRRAGRAFRWSGRSA